MGVYSCGLVLPLLLLQPLSCCLALEGRSGRVTHYVGTTGKSGRWVSVVDDPHFSAPDGLPFDFQGYPVLNQPFCLITDKQIQVNAFLGGYKDKRQNGDMAPDSQGLKLRSWMRQLAFLWLDRASGKPHSLRLVARVGPQVERKGGYLGAAFVDGKRVRNPYSGAPVRAAGASFQFTGVQNSSSGPEDTFSLTVDGILDGGFSLKPAIPSLRDPNNAWVHLNLFLNEFYYSANVHGVLGQLFPPTAKRKAQSAPFWQQYQATKKPVQADQDSGKGYLDGTVQDYLNSGILKPNCKYNRFNVKAVALKAMTKGKVFGWAAGRRKHIPMLQG